MAKKRKPIKRKTFEAYVLRMGGILRLGEWCIHQDWGEDKKAENGDTVMGTAHVTYQYREATIVWNPEILKAHPANITEYVAHELLHLRYAELQHIAEGAIKTLQNDERAARMHWQINAMETFITTVGRLLAETMPRIDRDWR